MTPLVTQGSKGVVHCSTVRVENGSLLLDLRFDNWSFPALCHEPPDADQLTAPHLVSPECARDERGSDETSHPSVFGFLLLRYDS